MVGRLLLLETPRPSTRGGCWASLSVAGEVEQRSRSRGWRVYLFLPFFAGPNCFLALRIHAARFFFGFFLHCASACPYCSWRVSPCTVLGSSGCGGVGTIWTGPGG